MKQLASILALLPFSLFAQTTWQVEAGGSTVGSTPPYYSPANITIQSGDIVHWNGVSGTHNVYGMLDAFPDNPEGFTSGEPAPNMNYTHTFTIPGVYQYHCTMQGHAATQFGSITVLGSTTGIATDAPAESFKMYPQPAQNKLTLDLGTSAFTRIDILSSTGVMLRSLPLAADQHPVIDLSVLAPGSYLLRLRDDKDHVATRTFVKQ